MEYKVYDVNFKISAVGRFKESGQTMRAFAESIGVNVNTFASWVRRDRLSAPEAGNRGLIDIKDRVADYLSPGIQPFEGPTFSLSVNGFKLEFGISSLREVIRELSHD